MGPTSTPRDGAPSTHLALRVALVGFLYMAAARLGTEVAIDDHFTPIWVPAGIALVAVLRWGPWMALGVGIGEALVSVTIGIPPGVAIALGIGNAIEPLVAVTIVRRLGMGDSIRRVRDAFVLLVAIAIGATVSSTIGVGAFLVADGVDLDGALREWALFWASVVLAVVLIAPLVLALIARGRDIEHRASRLLEASILLLSVVLTSSYMLDGSHPYATVLLYPLFVWGALRFGVIGASGTILLATVVAVSYEIADPNVLPELGLDRTASVLAVQAILATAAIGNLVLAALLLERDASRLALQRSASALEEAQEIAQLGSWEWDERDGLIRTSAEFQRVFRVGPEPTASLDVILEHVHPDDREALERSIHATLAGDGGFSVEHRLHRGTDERVVLHAGRMTSRQGASRSHLVATALDITERTSLDRLRDALVATASHELRTPLTSIVGFADTLLEHWERFDEARRLEFLRIIRTQGRRLSNVVDDTLMQSRLDAGSLIVAEDPYPVVTAIEEAVELAGIDDVAVRCDTSLVAVGSQEHLTQIVVNFLTNAVKYGRAPYVIDVREIEQGARIEVQVIDHGDGVDPSFRERLFERFTRGPGTDAQPGTGLGMSIVRGLAAANGGRVWYERDGDRSVFSCTVRRWAREHAPR
ncbi:MAG: periplasmic sensor signal transduction histidine kinase [Thermoleophilia bacterium]|nr:periplasmic sensor signal transduction histidine kinase [Thermoleophilia bacterium]